MATVGKLPDSWIGHWHQVAKFLNNNVAPVITASGMTITKATRGSALSMSESKATMTESAHCDHEERIWQKASESVITHYIFAEDVEGASQEALLCLQKGNVQWDTWHTMDKAVSRIATNEKLCHELCKDENAEKLRIRIFFAEDDEMIGKSGQVYLENCFANATNKEYLDFHSEIVPGTDHNEVLTVSRGAVGKVMEAVSMKEIVEYESDSENEEHEGITLRDVLNSPVRSKATLRC